MNIVCETAKKWYALLGFPAEFDKDFEALLSQYPDLKDNSVNDFVLTSVPERASENLIMFLYFCDSLEQEYKMRNIPQDILINTLSDIVIWSKVNYSVTGRLGLSELSWIKRHLTCRLFRLGRLQFCIGRSPNDIDEISVAKGDDIIEVHIPAGPPLYYDDCVASFNSAKAFFKEYFPEYRYKCYTCYSWLLDRSLKDFMDESSNILKFQYLFKSVTKSESYDILKYTFSWDTTKEKLTQCSPQNRLAKDIKTAVLGGRKFYTELGYRLEK